MRVLLWHGWLLEGSGSNVGVARTAELLRSAGHDVLLLCQEPHPERHRWIDAWGTVGSDGVSDLVAGDATAVSGRCILLRPRIGTLLPVFVLDEYEGFVVKTFVDLSQEELDDYLQRNVDALTVAVRWHDSDAVITGHAVPGPVVAKRALGAQRYVAKVHGSDLEYAVRPQARYRRLAAEGLEAAATIAGASSDVLQRCQELVPAIREDRMQVIAPGVNAASFRPRVRREALTTVAEQLDADPDVSRGRPSSHDERVKRAIAERDADALDDLARSYDQAVPDPDAAARLRKLASHSAPVVGYFGKLIPQKGVELMLAGAMASSHHPAIVVVGFGLHREWLEALDIALRSGDAATLAWIRDAGGLSVEPASIPHSGETVFTGRLDHRYAPSAISAMDILVVPSILEEAFGMVAAEGAAAGALPLLAHHSGLAEVAGAIERAVDRPGLFSFEQGPGAVGRITAGIDRLLSIPLVQRDELRQEVSSFVAREYTWERTAELLLDAATGGR